MTTATFPLPAGDPSAPARPDRSERPAHPWRALWAMLVGFFMIMLDSNIVAIATPTLMVELHVGYATAVWVTSAYLLGFAVPLLVAGRLGDRFGPKNLYVIGLVLFTLASVWCGLSGNATMLISARVVQGVGAGVLTPQTLSTVTRIFPAHRRGAALGVWGTTAGVASLAGPLAGGGLVDGLGWQWIFFINVPIGIAALMLALWWIPVLPTHAHRFDLVGVALSGLGMFLLVFGLQEGQSAGWAPWIWAVLVAGVGFMWAFVYWQSINRREPLIPLVIFGDRDFSLCTVGVGIIAFATTAMMLPLMFYAQAVCALSPLHSALLIAPLAIANGALAPLVGVLADRYHPLPMVGFGFALLAVSLTWLSIEMAPGTPVWRLVLPLGAIGLAMAFLWSPLAATATRNLPPHLAGASSGVYNATRQLGAALGSAGMAAFMTTLIGAEMPVPSTRGASWGDSASTLELPAYLRESFSAAMSQSMLLPAFISLFGIVAALFLVGVGTLVVGEPADGLGDEDYDDADDDEDDDEDYVECILLREPDPEPARNVEFLPVQPQQQPRSAPVAGLPTDPVGSGHSLLTDVVPRAEPIDVAHNGSHVDDGQPFRPVAELLRRPDPEGPASYDQQESGH